VQGPQTLILRRLYLILVEQSDIIGTYSCHIQTKRTNNRMVRRVEGAEGKVSVSGLSNRMMEKSAK